MKILNLLNTPLTTAQWIILGIAAGIAVILLAILIYLLCILIFKPDIKAEVHAMDKTFKLEKKYADTEKRHIEAEIKVVAKGLNEKATKAQRMEFEVEQLRKELMKQGLVESHAKAVSDMTLEQLIRLKESDGKDLSGDFIINAIARKTLIDGEFQQRTDVVDFKVPLNITKNYGTADVEKLLTSFPSVSIAQEEGKNVFTYKTQGKTFALLSRLKEDGKFKLTLKCGPFYGQRLTQLYPESFQKAKFPHGMIWFTIDNGASLELVKLLVLISFNIAKAGY